MSKHQHWTVYCLLAGILLSVALGVVMTYSAYLQESHFQHSEMNHPWVFGITVNSLLVAVFVVPLSVIGGRVVQRGVENRRRHAVDSADSAKS